MTKLPLTERQNLVLTTIDAFTRRKGYPPSIRDVMREMGITSPNGMVCHIRALRDKGWLQQVPKHRKRRPERSLFIIPDGLQVGDRALKRLGGPGRPLYGTIVSSFTKTTGERHYVLEDADGGLHVYHESQVVPA